MRGGIAIVRLAPGASPPGFGRRSPGGRWGWWCAAGPGAGRRGLRRPVAPPARGPGATAPPPKWSASTGPGLGALRAARRAGCSRPPVAAGWCLGASGRPGGWRPALGLPWPVPGSGQYWAGPPRRPPPGWAPPSPTGASRGGGKPRPPPSPRGRQGGGHKARPPRKKSGPGRGG